MVAVINTKTDNWSVSTGMMIAETEKNVVFVESNTPKRRAIEGVPVSTYPQALYKGRPVSATELINVARPLSFHGHCWISYQSPEARHQTPRATFLPAEA